MEDLSRALLEKGIDPNMTRPFSDEYLLCITNSINMLDLLVECDLSITNESCVNSAIERSQANIVEYFLAHGTDTEVGFQKHLCDTNEDILACRYRGCR